MWGYVILGVAIMWALIALGGLVASFWPPKKMTDEERQGAIDASRYGF